MVECDNLRDGRAFKKVLKKMAIRKTIYSLKKVPMKIWYWVAVLIAIFIFKYLLVRPLPIMAAVVLGHAIFFLMLYMAKKEILEKECEL